MKKIITVIALLFLLLLTFFYLGKTAIVSTTGKTFAEKIANKMPEKTKTWIKKNIFTSEYLRLNIRNQEKQINELLDKEKKKNNLIIENFKKIYFEVPYEIETNKDNYKNLFFQTKFLSNGKNDFAIASGYIDIFEDNLILATGDGIMFKINLNDLSNTNEGFYAEVIDTNLKEIIKTEEFFQKSYYGIKDLLIFNSKVFLSFSNEIKKNCFNTGILIADLNLINMNFKKHSLSTTDCALVGKMDNALQGGRMLSFSNDEIMFTHGDWFQGNIAQNKESIFGKVIKYNFKNNSLEIISYGHRNPQGLFYLEDEEMLIETEHGPIGGDEINIINLKEKNIEKNYGWPIASYGRGTQQNAGVFIESTKKYSSHDGFIEPIKYYVPSIGISQILRVPNKFFQYDNNYQNFFVASLGTKISEGDLSLHHFQTEKDINKIIFEEIIHLQERIRDMIYSESLNSLILFIESDRMQKGGPSIAVINYIK